MEYEIKLEQNWCKGCYICVKICPKKVFDISELEGKHGFREVIVARPEDCIGCMLCENFCPDFAIEVTRREYAAKES